MKKVILTLCGATIIGISSFAQVQDTASTNYNQENPAVGDRPIQDQSQEVQDQNIQEQSEGAQDQSQEIQSESQTSPTQEGINADPSMERPNEMTPVEGKVGPNGEAIFRENGKYFYMNEAGEKVKIKKSELRDKTE